MFILPLRPTGRYQTQKLPPKIITAFADTTAGTSGVATIPLDPTDTVNLDPGEYDYDISVRTSNNETYTVMRGKLTLEYDVTRTAGTAGTAA